MRPSATDEGLAEYADEVDEALNGDNPCFDGECEACRLVDFGVSEVDPMLVSPPLTTRGAHAIVKPDVACPRDVRPSEWLGRVTVEVLRLRATPRGAYVAVLPLP